MENGWNECSPWSNSSSENCGEKFQDGKLLQKPRIGKKILSQKIGVKNYFVQKMEKFH